LIEALAIRKEKLGASHPEVADTLNNLAKVSEAMSKTQDALAYSRRATAALVAQDASNEGAVQKEDQSRALTTTHSDYFTQPVRSLAISVRAGLQADPAINGEAFEVAQRATQSSAAAALQQMSTVSLREAMRFWRSPGNVRTWTRPGLTSISA
jgi:hypothetical protein